MHWAGCWGALLVEADRTKQGRARMPGALHAAGEALVLLARPWCCWRGPGAAAAAAAAASQRLLLPRAGVYGWLHRVWCPPHQQQRPQRGGAGAGVQSPAGGVRWVMQRSKQQEPPWSALPPAGCSCCVSTCACSSEACKQACAPLGRPAGNAKTSRNNNSSRFGKWVAALLSRLLPPAQRTCNPAAPPPCPRLPACAISAGDLTLLGGLLGGCRCNPQPPRRAQTAAATAVQVRGDQLQQAGGDQRRCHPHLLAGAQPGGVDQQPGALLPHLLPGVWGRGQGHQQQPDPGQTESVRGECSRCSVHPGTWPSPAQAGSTPAGQGGPADAAWRCCGRRRLQICDGATPEERARWRLRPAKEFAYLSQSSCYEIPGTSNAEEYALTVRAMTKVGAGSCWGANAATPAARRRQPARVLLPNPRADAALQVGIPPERREAVMRTTASILHLGNITFEEGSSEWTANAPWGLACLGHRCGGSLPPSDPPPLLPVLCLRLRPACCWGPNVLPGLLPAPEVCCWACHADDDSRVPAKGPGAEALAAAADLLGVEAKVWRAGAGRQRQRAVGGAAAHAASGGICCV